MACGSEYRVPFEVKVATQELFTWDVCEDRSHGLIRDGDGVCQHLTIENEYFGAPFLAPAIP